MDTASLNPTSLGFGSGSPMVGQGGEVAQQMEQGAPAMSQMGAMNPAYTPGQQMNPYPALPNNGGSILPAPMAPQAPAAPEPPKTRADLIIQAFSNHLKHIQDIEKRLIPEPPQPPTV